MNVKHGLLITDGGRIKKAVLLGCLKLIIPSIYPYFLFSYLSRFEIIMRFKTLILEMRILVQDAPEKETRIFNLKHREYNLSSFPHKRIYILNYPRNACQTI